MKRLKYTACFVILLSVISCSTIVKLESDPSRASVYLDGEHIGETPLEIRLSNAIWEDYHVRIEKRGYLTKTTTLEREIKPKVILLGILFGYIPLLWCHGPADYQYFTLYPENSSGEMPEDAALLTVGTEDYEIYLDGEKLAVGTMLVNAGEHEVRLKQWGLTGEFIQLSFQPGMAYEIR